MPRDCMRQYKTGEVLDMTTRHWMYVTYQEKTDVVWDNTRQARWQQDTGCMWHAKRRQKRYETIQDRRGVRHDNKTLDLTQQDRRGVRHDNKTVDVCDIPREDRRGMRQYKTGEMLDMTTRHWM